MRPHADGHEGAGSETKLVGGNDQFSDLLPLPQARTPPSPQRPHGAWPIPSPSATTERPRLSLAGDAAHRAVRALAARLPDAVPPAVAVPPLPPTSEVAERPVAPKLTPAEVDRRQRRERQEANAARTKRLHAMARDFVLRYPATFTEPPTPVAVGIDKSLIAAVAGLWSKKAVRYFLRLWTDRRTYLAAVASGELRRGLDGVPTEAPSERDREHAAARLAAGAAARRQTCTGSPHRLAPPPEAMQ